VAFGIKSRMAQHLCVNLKDTKYIIDLDAEKKILLNRIIKYYVDRIAVYAEVSLIQTAVKCTAAFSIHIDATFELSHVAGISICFHGNIARSTVREILLHILPQVQPKLALLSPC
jgi:hypothetical protein